MITFLEVWRYARQDRDRMVRLLFIMAAFALPWIGVVVLLAVVLS